MFTTGLQPFIPAGMNAIPGIFRSIAPGRKVWQKPYRHSTKEGETVIPLDYTKDLSCPLLGLFGREDKRPSPEHVAKTEAELKKWGKTYEFHMYDNAGHAFFWVDTPRYRHEAAVDGWKRVFQWYEKYLR